MDLVGRRTLAFMLALALVTVGLTFVLPDWYERLGWALGAAFLGSALVVGFEMYQRRSGGKNKNNRGTDSKKRR